MVEMGYVSFHHFGIPTMIFVRLFSIKINYQIFKDHLAKEQYSLIMKVFKRNTYTILSSE
jgi:hypothetical protein